MSIRDKIDKAVDRVVQDAVRQNLVNADTRDETEKGHFLGSDDQSGHVVDPHGNSYNVLYSNNPSSIDATVKLNSTTAMMVDDSVRLMHSGAPKTGFAIIFDGAKFFVKNVGENPIAEIPLTDLDGSFPINNWIVKFTPNMKHIVAAQWKVASGLVWDLSLSPGPALFINWCIYKNFKIEGNPLVPAEGTLTFDEKIAGGFNQSVTESSGPWEVPPVPPTPPTAIYRQPNISFEIQTNYTEVPPHHLWFINCDVFRPLDWVIAPKFIVSNHPSTGDPILDVFGQMDVIIYKYSLSHMSSSSSTSGSDVYTEIVSTAANCEYTGTGTRITVLGTFVGSRTYSIPVSLFSISNVWFTAFWSSGDSIPSTTEGSPLGPPPFPGRLFRQQNDYTTKNVFRYLDVVNNFAFGPTVSRTGLLKNEEQHVNIHRSAVIFGQPVNADGINTNYDTIFEDGYSNTPLVGFRSPSSGNKRALYFGDGQGWLFSDYTGTVTSGDAGATAGAFTDLFSGTIGAFTNPSSTAVRAVDSLKWVGYSAGLTTSEIKLNAYKCRNQSDPLSPIDFIDQANGDLGTYTLSQVHDWIMAVE